MLSKTFRKGALALALVVVGAGSALAVVTFDPTCGLSGPGFCGFVGKGDVQNPWNLNNAQMQAAAQNVTFTYEASESYAVTVEFWTGPVQNRQQHIVTQRKSANVAAAIAADPRRTGQFTGWHLTEIGVGQPSGDNVPEVGDSCPNGDTCEVISVTLVSSTGGLFASNANINKGPTKIWP